MDGLFELLFILLFILAAIFDAVARSRGKRRRMEEMEAEEAGEEAPSLEGADDSAQARREERRERRREEWERRRQEAEARRAEAEAQRRGRDVGGEPREAGTSSEGAGAPSQRETADAMVPDDLWAILTGQPRAPREPESAPRGSPPGEVASREESPIRPEAEPSLATPAPRPVRTPSQAPATRRSSRWMDGVGGREESDRWTRGVTREMEDEERRAYNLPPSPWGAMEDISAGDISDGGGRVQTAGPEEEEPPRRRGRRPSIHAGAYLKGTPGREGAERYTRLLTGTSLEDLRTAIVLREVLGPPVGFREEGGGGDGPAR